MKNDRLSDLSRLNIGSLLLVSSVHPVLKWGIQHPGFCMRWIEPVPLASLCIVSKKPGLTTTDRKGDI